MGGIMNIYKKACESKAFKKICPVFKKIGHWIQHFWTFLKDVGYVLLPGLFSIIILLAGAVILLLVPQGKDAVLALAGGGFWLRLFFGIAGVLWAVQIWYWARTLFLFWHVENRSSHHHPGYIKTIPRVLGTLALLVVAASSFMMDKYSPGSAHFRLGIIFLFLAVIFYIFVHKRRAVFKLEELDKVVDKVEGMRRGRSSSGAVDRSGFRDLPKGSRHALWTLTFLSLLPMILFLASPHLFCLDGGAAVILLCFSIWVPAGSWILYSSHRTRIPWFTTIIICAAIFGMVNDNHHVRVLDEKAEQITLKKRLDVFLNNYPSKDDVQAEVQPLYIVIAEGGGIRAAFWTAVVLGHIQDRWPGFAPHLLAISSVSGGSLGASVFASLLAEQKYPLPTKKTLPQGSLKETSADILARDFLSPTAVAMLTGDVVQRILPFGVNHFSRGLALEEAWENAWDKVRKNSRFSNSMTDLWVPDTEGYIPSLFFNGTKVESGQRIIASNIRIDSRFDAEDIFHKYLGNKAMRMSTAVHNSARFTYVSPAGTLPGGLHVVDGGYFDNSGGSTAIEIYLALRSHPLFEQKKFKVIALLLVNDPAEPSIMPLRFLSGVYAPIGAILKVRTQHAAFSRGLLERLVKADNGDVVLFKPREKDLKLPLGWSLSDEVRKKMIEHAEEQVEQKWEKMLCPSPVKN